jgi:phospholipid/cholesterol/gamma-HCH transport system permease protein
MAAIADSLRRTTVRTGGAVVEGLGQFGAMLEFSGRVIYHAVVDVVFKLKYRNVVFAQVSDIIVGRGAYVMGAGIVVILMAMALAVGATVGIQAYVGLETIGAEAFVGVVGAFANIRELAPLITAAAIAALVGASFTAELGAMRISEEVDALEVMGIPSVVYLLSTRLVALVISVVPLFLLAILTSFLGTRLITTTFFGQPEGVYDYYFELYLPPIDVLFSLIKVFVFMMIIGLVHLFYGYYVRGGPVAVGIAVGRAIRLVFILIVLVNFALSYIFWGQGGTVSITG